MPDVVMFKKIHTTDTVPTAVCFWKRPEDQGSPLIVFEALIQTRVSGPLGLLHKQFNQVYTGNV